MLRTDIPVVKSKGVKSLQNKTSSFSLPILTAVEPQNKGHTPTLPPLSLPLSLPHLTRSLCCVVCKWTYIGHVPTLSDGEIEGAVSSPVVYPHTMLFTTRGGRAETRMERLLLGGGGA